MRQLAALLLLALPGCAMTAQGIGSGNVDLYLSSPKPPRQVAACLAQSLMGSNPMIEVAEDHFVITRQNTFQMPVVRWDIIGTPTGSRLEMRSSVRIATGADKARACL